MDSVLAQKSEEFAVRIINLYKFLAFQKSEYVLSKQILRSGTSIGANVAEAQEAISKRDFLSKISISLKEANETHYWLRLLHRTNYISTEEYNSLEKDCKELLKLLTSSIKTIRHNLDK